MTTDQKGMVPDFPHLPASVAVGIARYDARITSGALPIGDDGHVVIPAGAESWITEWLAAHLPAPDVAP